MSTDPNPERHRRTYRSPMREEKARRTRRAIVATAHDSFVAEGYAGTTMREVATRAGVSTPTVELTFGTKRQLLKAVVDVTTAGDDEPVPMLERRAAQDAAAASTAAGFAALIAAEIGVVSARVSGILSVLAGAGPSDPEIAGLAEELGSQRRNLASWMVGHLCRYGTLRPGLDAKSAVDIVWVFLDPALHVRLARDCGWSEDQFAGWLGDSLLGLLEAA